MTPACAAPPRWSTLTISCTAAPPNCRAANANASISASLSFCTSGWASGGSGGAGGSEGGFLALRSAIFLAFCAFFASSLRFFIALIVFSSTPSVFASSIGTPPPQLVVVKDGLNNVPAVALFGNAFHTPGNAGMETWFWETPSEAPATLAAIEAAVVGVPTAAARAEAAAEARAAGGGFNAGKILGWVIVVGAVVGVARVAVRYPFIGRRLALMVPTLAVVSVLVFVIVQLPPGDYVESRIMELEMEGTTSSERTIADLRANFYLDEPMAVRYLRWVGLWWFTSFDAGDAGLLQGNLGR